MIVFSCAVIPHVTNAIQEWVERVAQIPVGKDDKQPDICIIEVWQMDIFCLCLLNFSTPQLGGTIGDIEGMPFVEAFRQFQFRVGLQNFTNIHVSLVPQVSSLLVIVWKTLTTTFVHLLLR